jgi:predicted NAD/FAD-binding protein
MERVAVIGSGISGLVAAQALSRQPGGPGVTLFEAAGHFGGHAHTVDLTLDGQTHGVDTGFLVYNERTYPGLTRLFGELDVKTSLAEMSFSVQVLSRQLEWSGSDLAGVFAQPRNLLRPAFWRMLAEIVRFNRLCTGMAQRGDEVALAQRIGDFLDEHRFSQGFRAWYLLPMVASIWSCTSEQMLSFPIASLIRFCHNHGLLQVTQRPQWKSVLGGSREYVRRMVAQIPDARLNSPVMSLQRDDAGVRLRTRSGTEHFDQVVLACHSDQALHLLGDQASPEERQVLGAIRYRANRAVLHTDASLLPSRRAAWAAWNYEAVDGDAPGGVCLHYLLNRLQTLPWQQPVIVSLNPIRDPDPARVACWLDYAHPVFDQAAMNAQRRLPSLQGLRRTWFCGAWAGYGFHEDGLQSGLAVAAALLGRKPVTWLGAA